MTATLTFFTLPSLTHCHSEFPQGLVFERLCKDTDMKPHPEQQGLCQRYDFHPPSIKLKPRLNSHIYKRKTHFLPKADGELMGHTKPVQPKSFLGLLYMCEHLSQASPCNCVPRVNVLKEVKARLRNCLCSSEIQAVSVHCHTRRTGGQSTLMEHCISSLSWLSYQGLL